jgi:hypothetical protein
VDGAEQKGKAFFPQNKKKEQRGYGRVTTVISFLFLFFFLLKKKLMPTCQKYLLKSAFLTTATHAVKSAHHDMTGSLVTNSSSTHIKESSTTNSATSLHRTSARQVHPVLLCSRVM